MQENESNTTTSTSVPRPISHTRGSIYVAKHNHKASTLPPPPTPNCINVYIHTDESTFGGDLSPYHLRTREGFIIENVWQFSKLYPKVPAQNQPQYQGGWTHPQEVHCDPKTKKPTDAYWRWRHKGFMFPHAVRYPVGTEARAQCLCSIWPMDASAASDNQCLGYIEARKRIYCGLYAQCAPSAPSFAKMQRLLSDGTSIQIIEVDGPNPELQYAPYDRICRERPGLLMDAEVVNLLLHDKRNPFGHGFTIAALLIQLDPNDPQPAGYFGPTTKPVVLFSSQLFGSGKTFFADHAIEHLAGDFERLGPITQNLVNPSPPDEIDDRCGLAGLRNFSFTQEAEGQRARQAVPYWILATLNGNTPYANFENIPFMHPGFIYEKILMPKWNGNWFICFDEVGVFEGSSAKAGFPELTKNCFLPLLECVQELILTSKGKVFVFLCGKSWTLINLALGDVVTSPLHLQYLAMGALNAADVELILQSSDISRFLPSPLLAPLAELIYDLSGGVPRIIHIMSWNLWSHLCHSSPVETIEHLHTLLAPTGIIGQHVLSDTTIFSEATKESLPRQELDKYEVMLLHIYMLNAVIPSARAAKILSVFPCYITPFRNGFKPTFSKYWIHKTENRTDRAMPLSSLLSLVQTSPPVLSQGRLLELVSAEVLCLWFMYATKNTIESALPFLKNTVLGPVLLSVNISTTTSKMFFTPTCIPMLNSITTKGHPTQFSYNHQDWDLYVKMLQEKYLHQIGLPPETSQGPDLVIPLALNSEATSLVCATEETAITHLLEFAFKNIQGGSAGTKSKSNWSTIQAEVDKCLYAPRKSDVQIHLTLVFASTELVDAVFSVFKGYPWIVLSSKDTEMRWYLNTKTKSLVKENPGTGSQPSLSIPPNCDVIILGAEGMDTLFGGNTLQILRNHFRSSANMVEYFDGLSLVLESIQNLIGGNPYTPSSVDLRF
ncbi:hypothetical protein Pelo_15632 [Pelomyxa schiedti]|nr:hypothetical protein Pelo_15632 [Pelomyxa schiedti]